MVLGRFELMLVLRNQVGDRALVRRSLAVEAVMEELAGALGHDAVLWGLCGLGADIDAELTAGNPDRRGGVAEELLLTEGAPAEVAAAARLQHGGAVAGMPPLARGLVAAGALVDIISELPPDEREARTVAFALAKRGRRGDARPLQALAALALDPEQAAGLALVAYARALP